MFSFVRNSAQALAGLTPTLLNLASPAQAWYNDFRKDALCRRSLLSPGTYPSRGSEIMVTLSTIQVLPPEVAERIAAGEVVERPASAVKELIENSLDADATAISVEIRDGGLSLIRVSDDGCGMSRTDAPRALERFATSKIRTLDDLEGITTLGFRGEALSSITAVAQLELLTRTRDELEGTRVRSVPAQQFPFWLPV